MVPVTWIITGTTLKTSPRWSATWKRKREKTPTTWRPTWPCWSCTFQLTAWVISLYQFRLTILDLQTHSDPFYEPLRYQFNPAYFQTQVTSQILLKALTNLPHTDFTLCKCMIDQTHVSFGCSVRFCSYFAFVIVRWVLSWGFGGGGGGLFPWLLCRSKRSVPSGRSSTWGTCWRPATFRASGYEAHGNTLQRLHLIQTCRSRLQSTFYKHSSPLGVPQASLEENRELIDGITGFEDSVRKCEHWFLTNWRQ